MFRSEMPVAWPNINEGIVLLVHQEINPWPRKRIRAGDQDCVITVGEGPFAIWMQSDNRTLEYR